jgi:hypothetical protein
MFLIAVMVISCVGAVSARSSSDIEYGKMIFNSFSNYMGYISIESVKSNGYYEFWYVTNANSRIKKWISDYPKIANNVGEHHIQACFEAVGWHKYTTDIFIADDIDWAKGVYLEGNTYGKPSDASLHVLYYDLHGIYQDRKVT